MAFHPDDLIDTSPYRLSLTHRQKARISSNLLPLLEDFHYRLVLYISQLPPSEF